MAVHTLLLEETMPVLVRTPMEMTFMQLMMRRNYLKNTLKKLDLIQN